MKRDLTITEMKKTNGGVIFTLLFLTALIGVTVIAAVVATVVESDDS